MKWFISALIVALTVGQSYADERPNIVVIVVDDVGRDWLSSYGAKHQTPNVDRLAKQGVLYQTAWATPNGTATRLTLLSGQYPFRHGRGKHSSAEGFSWKKFTSFARVLRDSGYATAIGGQWQLNHLDKQANALKLHGFDEHCVWPETEGRYWEADIITNGRRETVPYGPDKINDFLLDFIKRKKDRPFLVYYPMRLAHGPHATTPLNKTDRQGASRSSREKVLVASTKTEKVSKDDVALYAVNVTYVDRLVGKLVKAIDDAGQKDNTLIIFTSDNGSAFTGVLHGKPLPKGKGRESDIGAHVPFIVRAPFLTDGGQVSRDLIDFTDLYPTFLELAKVKGPENLALDGKSFVPSLRGSEDPFDKRNWIYSQVGDFRMIRDWHHTLDSKGGFHDINKDPLQEHKVSPQDKIAPGRRQRLQMILDRLQKTASSP
ncbi:MAG: hypothetical protein CMJ78_23190 [Planctomycetaceae bacterium]|nr:hypothetical protein [Planctomycetaceae bacterium]